MEPPLMLNYVFNNMRERDLVSNEGTNYISLLFPGQNLANTLEC